MIVFFFFNWASFFNKGIWVDYVNSIFPSLHFFTPNQIKRREIKIFFSILPLFHSPIIFYLSIFLPLTLSSKYQSDNKSKIKWCHVGGVHIYPYFPNRLYSIWPKCPCVFARIHFLCGSTSSGAMVGKWGNLSLSLSLSHVLPFFFRKKFWNDFMCMYMYKIVCLEFCLDVMKIRTSLFFGQITIYSHVVWPKFKLPTCALKFNTLPTWG